MTGTEFIFPNAEEVDWGLMIVLYPYITGLVAGAFVVSALAHVFDKQELKPIAKFALVASFCFCAFATLPLLLHLHHPARALNIIVTPNFTSAMSGFGFIYSFYMLLLTVEIWLVFRADIVAGYKRSTGAMKGLYKVLALGVTEITEKGHKLDQKVIHALAILGIPAACVLHGYVGFLFGAVKANPWWSSAMMPVVFLCSAIVSGIAALIVMYLFIGWRTKRPARSDTLRSMMRYLWIFLVAAVTLELLELMNKAYEAGEEWHVISQLLTEHLFFSFFIVQLLLGSLVPLIFLRVAARPGASDKLMRWMGGSCAVLVLIQVMAMRFNVVIGGQLFSKSFRGFIDYDLPMGGSEGLIAGITVLVLPFILLYAISKVLPLWDEADQVSSDVETPAETPPSAERAIA